MVELKRESSYVHPQNLDGSPRGCPDQSGHKFY